MELWVFSEHLEQQTSLPGERRCRKTDTLVASVLDNTLSPEEVACCCVKSYSKNG